MRTAWTLTTDGRSGEAAAKNPGWQGAKGSQVRLKPDPDRLRAGAGAAIEFRKAIRFKLRVQRLEACGDGNRRQKPPAAIFNESLDLALVIALAGPPQPITKQIILDSAADVLRVGRIVQSQEHEPRYSPAFRSPSG